MKPNILLVGFMGAGKTSTGEELAGLLKFGFYDMDRWIEERAGMRVHEIFSQRGETFFRELEKEAVGLVDGKTRTVISTGGGSWLDQDNRSKMLQAGWCVWLKATPDQVWKRVSGNLSQRPLLNRNADPQGEIQRLVEERNPVYAKTHFSLETDGKSPAQVAVEIRNALRENHPFDLSQL